MQEDCVRTGGPPYQGVVLPARAGRGIRATLHPPSAAGRRQSGSCRAAKQLLQLAQRRLQPLRPLQDALKQIALLQKPRGSVADVEVLGVEAAFHLFPFERRGDRGTG